MRERREKAQWAHTEYEMPRNISTSAVPSLDSLFSLPLYFLTTIRLLNTDGPPCSVFGIFKNIIDMDMFVNICPMFNT